MFLLDFLKAPGSILDVRSPSEFLQGRLPHSHSFPLLNDVERAQVGTCYKNRGQQAAIDLGLELVGPKLSEMVRTGRHLLSGGQGKFLCWRGGMRSHFVANLFESFGYKCVTLRGGYKTFRRWALKTLEEISPSIHLHVLGGFTGSGKTAILQTLRELGEQVIDLEALGNHHGSAFGAINGTPQPSQEQFENELAYLMSQFDHSKRIWIEDESRMIGVCHLPETLYKMMNRASFYYIERPQEERLSHLMTIYGKASPAWLINCTQRIAKRLGGLLAQQIITALENRQIEEAFMMLLSYYDKAYQHQISKKTTPMYRLEGKGLSTSDWAKKLIGVI